MPFYHEIEQAKRTLQAAEHAYLKRWGWEYSSNIPGAMWMWRRDFGDVDAKRMDWWIEHTTPKQREKDFGHGMPSKPHPYGFVTATTDLAVAITARELDEQPEVEQMR